MPILISTVEWDMDIFQCLSWSFNSFGGGGGNFPKFWTLKKQVVEPKRRDAAMRNKYDIFTKPQADNVKLLESQWLELQQIVSWIESWFAYGMQYMEQPPKIGKIALRCFEISASQFGFKFTYWVHVCRIMVAPFSLRNLSLMSFMPSWQLWWKTCDHSKVVTNASNAHIMNPFRDSILMVTGRQGHIPVLRRSITAVCFFMSFVPWLESEIMATWILDNFSTSIEMALSPSGEIRVPNAS